MSWIERTTKKRIKELDEHPELNSNNFEQKGRLNRYIGDMLIYSTLMMSI